VVGGEEGVPSSHAGSEFDSRNSDEVRIERQFGNRSPAAMAGACPKF
jgi:hypothetical protein